MCVVKLCWEPDCLMVGNNYICKCGRFAGVTGLVAIYGRDQPRWQFDKRSVGLGGLCRMATRPKCLMKKKLIPIRYRFSKEDR